METREEKRARVAAFFAKKEASLKAIGLSEEGAVPNGFIALTPDGPAEEFFPGLFRTLHGVGWDEVTGKITGKLEDSDGFGVRHEIIGIVPMPIKTEKPKKVRMTAEEAGLAAMENEANE